MKNLLAEKPNNLLHGRLLASVNFVADTDLAGKEVLDIGCGYGWCEFNFLGRGVKKMSAIEISENDLETIRQNIKDERLALKTGQADNLPFSAESFDTVVSWDVIEHIPKNTEPAMFKEIYRVLKIGGIFYLSTPFKYFFADIFDPAWWLAGHRHYSSAVLRQFARDNNFEVLEIKTAGGWWSLISIIVMYVSKWLFKSAGFFNDFLNRKENE